MVTQKEIEDKRAELLSELAFGYFSEDWLSKDEIQEYHDEAEWMIESAEPQDDENYIWDNGYIRGYIQAMRDIKQK